MKIATACFDDLVIDFSKKEMQGNGMSGNGIEILSNKIEDFSFLKPREMNGNGII